LGLTKAIDLAALASISIISTLVLERDFQVRLCQILEDESLVAHTHFFKHPEHFRLDAEFNSWSPIALSSLLNWLPAQLSQLTNIQPLVFFVAALLIQNSGIVCSTYLLGRSLTFNQPTSRTLSLLAAIFVLAWHPQWLNASLIRGLDWMPYSNWFALPFSLGSFYYIVQKSPLKSWLFICISTLIHPILGGLTSLPVTLYAILATNQKHRFRTICFCLVMTALLVALVLIPISISTASLQFVSDNNRSQILQHNIHASPWRNHYPYGISSLIASLTYSALFSIIALLPAPGYDKSSKGRLFMWCTLVVVASATFIHFSASALGLTSIQNLIASRSTILLLMVATPLAVWKCWTALLKGNIYNTVAVLLFIFYVNPLTLFAATLTIISTRLNSTPYSHLLKFACQLISMLTTLVVLCWLNPAWTNQITAAILSPILGVFLQQMMSEYRLSIFDWRVFLLSLAITLLLKKLIERRRISENHFEWFLCLTIASALCFCSITENRKIGKREVNETLPYCQMQLWVRDNTPPDSSFILVNPTNSMAWRGLTERQIITINPIGQIYKSTKIARDYNKRLSAFWEKAHTIQLNDYQHSLDIDTASWLSFAREFGGDYIVRRADWPILNLPICYKNETFIIFKIHKSNQEN
jgi:hypothetical protein